MNRCFVVCAITLFVLTFGVVERVHADIGPERIAKLKQKATDVFQIEVIDVKVDDSKAVQRRTIIKAKVIAVQRSSVQPKRGDLIEIHSYQIRTDGVEDPTELLDTIVAPKAPPPLERGWNGTVFLNAKDIRGDIKSYTIAVYGYSFQPATTAKE